MAIGTFLLYLGVSRSGLSSQANGDLEKGRPEIRVIHQRHVQDDEVTVEPNDVDNEGNEDRIDTLTNDAPLPRKHRLSSGIAFTSFSTISSITQVKRPPRWLSKTAEYIFPPKENLDSFIPNYRYTPIFSGVIIPFSILLEIPGLTEHWYIRTEFNKTVETKPNPTILDVGMAFSIVCAIIANLCLIMRFLEKRVKTMTILCTVFLTVHGEYCLFSLSYRCINVPHRFDQYYFCNDFRCRASFRRWVYIRSGFLDDCLLNHMFVYNDRNSDLGSTPNTGFQQEW